jgi:predicted small metal-binding protein
VSAKRVGAYDGPVKRINCICGYLIEAEDDDELLEKVQDHLRVDHPELVGKVSRDDILAQAEET